MVEKTLSSYLNRIIESRVFENEYVWLKKKWASLGNIELDT